MHTLEMRQHFNAPPAAVFAVLTDHVGMSRWLPGTSVSLAREGTPRPNGLGAVRRIRASGLTVEEEVVRWEEPDAMDYRIVGWSPIRDHLGEVRFRPSAGGGTDVEYRIRFAARWYLGGPLLGNFVARQLRQQIGEGLARLATQLTSGSGTPPG